MERRSTDRTAKSTPRVPLPRSFRLDMVLCLKRNWLPHTGNPRSLIEIERYDVCHGHYDSGTPFNGVAVHLLRLPSGVNCKNNPFDSLGPLFVLDRPVSVRGALHCGRCCMYPPLLSGHRYLTVHMFCRCPEASHYSLRGRI